MRRWIVGQFIAVYCWGFCVAPDRVLAASVRRQTIAVGSQVRVVHFCQRLSAISGGQHHAWINTVLSWVVTTWGRNPRIGTF